MRLLSGGVDGVAPHEVMQQVESERKSWTKLVGRQRCDRVRWLAKRLDNSRRKLDNDAPTRCRVSREFEHGCVSIAENRLVDHNARGTRPLRGNRCSGAQHNAAA
jgi:hypothetical protein